MHQNVQNEQKEDKNKINRSNNIDDKSYILWNTKNVENEQEQHLQQIHPDLLLPRLVHRHSRLSHGPGGGEHPLCHVVHAMRNIEFDVSVFGAGSAVGGYSLIFKAEGGNVRGERYTGELLSQITILFYILNMRV